MGASDVRVTFAQTGVAFDANAYPGHQLVRTIDARFGAVTGVRHVAQRNARQFVYVAERHARHVSNREAAIMIRLDLDDFSLGKVFWPNFPPILLHHPRLLVLRRMIRLQHHRRRPNQNRQRFLIKYNKERENKTQTLFTLLTPKNAVLSSESAFIPGLKSSSSSSSSEAAPNDSKLASNFSRLTTLTCRLPGPREA
uniref:Uncharacterized protein n=1 Tax=Romanomermis culicivorax TaxID=13658 RepID=A0A915IEF8_ROMCU